jgi:hypothetical protein
MVIKKIPIPFPRGGNLRTMRYLKIVLKDETSRDISCSLLLTLCSCLLLLRIFFALMLMLVLYLTFKSISCSLVLLFKNLIISLVRLCLFSSLDFTQIMCVFVDFINSNLSPEREKYAQLLGIGEAIRSQITCFANPNVEFPVNLLYSLSTSLSASSLSIFNLDRGTSIFLCVQCFYFPFLHVEINHYLSQALCWINDIN